MSDNVIELRDRERIRENLARPSDPWDRVRDFIAGVERRIIGPEHDASRNAVCCQCRKSGDKGELDLIGVYVHPRCAAKVERRMREPVNVWEDLTAVLSVVLIAAVAVHFVIVPIVGGLVGR